MTDKPVALVTGGASGLGAAIVAHFARKGWGVALNYRDEAKADAVLSDLEQAGSAARVQKVRADVTNRSEVRRLFDDAVAAFGKVDILINCAGFNRDAAFLEMTDEAWDSVVAVHLKGPFICCQEYVIHNPTDPGHIINLGATCEFQGRQNGVNFHSAKGGVLALTKCLARELAPRIRVNCLIPGQVDTPEVRTRYHLDRPEARDKVVSGIPMGHRGLGRCHPHGGHGPRGPVYDGRQLLCQWRRLHALKAPLAAPVRAPDRPTRACNRNSGQGTGP